MPSVAWGAKEIPGVIRVSSAKNNQNPTPFRTSETRRGDRQGVRSIVIDTLEGGLGVQYGSETAHLSRYASSGGLWAHQSGKLTLPPIVQSQNNLITADFSGHGDANNRPTMSETTLGQSKPRLYASNGVYMFRTTSDTDHSLTNVATLTDEITFIGNIVANSTDYQIICTDGTTNDIQVNSDPSQTTWSTGLAEFLALSSGDRIDWVWSSKDLGNGFNIFSGKIGSLQGIFYTKHSDALGTTPSMVVDTETATQPNANNAVVSVTKQAGFAYNNGSAGTVGWTTSELANITASDDTRVTLTANLAGGSSTLTYYLVTGGYRFNLPSGSLLTGITYSPEVSETASPGAIFWGTSTTGGVGGLWPVLAGSIQTTFSFNPQSTVLGNTDSTDTVGSSTQMPMQIDVDDVNDVGFGMAMQFIHEAADADASDARVDAAPITVSYRPSGTQVWAALGSELVGENPVVKNSIIVLEPVDDDATSQSVPRQLVVYTFDYASVGDRPTVTKEVVDTGLVYNKKACIGGGSLFVAGGSASGAATTIHEVDLVRRTFVTLSDVRSGLPTADSTVNSPPNANNEFFTPGQGLTENWRIYDLWHTGDSLGMTLCNVDEDTIQDFVVNHRNGSLHAFSPPTTVNSAPLTPKGQTIVGSELQRRYWFVPDSTTALDVYRQYTPNDIHLDVFSALSGEDKQDGPLTITLPELVDAFGDLPSSKQILAAYCYSRNISATSTVKLEYSTDGGTNWTTWDTFTSFGDSNTLTTPVSFSTLTLRITLDRGATATDTPNGLPIVIVGISEWARSRTFTVELDLNLYGGDFYNKYPGGIDELWDTLNSLGPANTLETGSESARCTWRDYRMGYKPHEIGTDPQHDNQGTYVLVFDEVIP